MHHPLLWRRRGDDAGVRGKSREVLMFHLTSKHPLCNPPQQWPTSFQLQLFHIFGAEKDFWGWGEFFGDGGNVFGAWIIFLGQGEFVLRREEIGLGRRKFLGLEEGFCCLFVFFCLFPVCQYRSMPPLSSLINQREGVKSCSSSRRNSVSLELVQLQN